MHYCFPILAGDKFSARLSSRFQFLQYHHSQHILIKHWKRLKDRVPHVWLQRHQKQYPQRQHRSAPQSKIKAFHRSWHPQWLAHRLIGPQWTITTGEDWKRCYKVIYPPKCGLCRKLNAIPEENLCLEDPESKFISKGHKFKLNLCPIPGYPVLPVRLH